MTRLRILAPLVTLLALLFVGGLATSVCALAQPTMAMDCCAACPGESGGAGGESNCQCPACAPLEASSFRAAAPPLCVGRLSPAKVRRPRSAPFPPVIEYPPES